MTRLTSRERMLRALNLQFVDPIPCCFMIFAALRKRVQESKYALVEAEQELGLDSVLFLPLTPRAGRPEHPDLRGLPIRFSSDVELREWRERQGEDTVLHKEYVTPAGTLCTSVRLSKDWPHGNHVPFVDDYQVPRTTKPLVTGPEDLAPLQYLLGPPREGDEAGFLRQAAEAHAFAERQGVLVAGGWGIGLDMASWLCGIERLMILTMEQEQFVVDLLEIIHSWNTKRMKVILSAPVDLYIHRAWYEGCDFVTPAFFRRAILPRLKQEVDLVHEKGAKFGYICTSGTQPMLEAYLEAGIDTLIGVDPVQGTHTNLLTLKKELGARACLWGGVSGAVTVETGSEEEVRSEVRKAIEVLGPTGLILSPVDNVRIDTPKVWRNIKALIDDWRSYQTPTVDSPQV